MLPGDDPDPGPVEPARRRGTRRPRDPWSPLDRARGGGRCDPRPPFRVVPPLWHHYRASRRHRYRFWSARLTLAEFGHDDGLLAGLGVFRKVVLHAGLDTTAAGLNTRAGLLHIRLACFDYRDTIQQSLLAGLGELGEMLLDARPDAAFAGLQPRAMLLDLYRAGLANGRLLRHAIGRSQKKQGCEGGSCHSIHERPRSSLFEYSGLA